MNRSTARVWERRAWLSAALFCAFLACATVKSPFSHTVATAVRLGVADAVALVALVRLSRSRLDDVCIVLAELTAAFAAERLAGLSGPLVNVSTLLNGGQILLAAYFVRRLAPGGAGSVAQGWRFLAVSAAVIGSLGSALLLLLIWRGVVHRTPAVVAVYTAGKLLAFVIVAPLAMGLTREAVARLELKSRWPEALALAGVVLAVSAAALTRGDPSWLFAASPFVIWITFRFRLPGAACAVLLMAVVVVVLTKSSGIGAAGLNPSDATALAVLSLFTLNVLTAVPIAAALNERDGLAQIAEERAAARIEAEASYRLLADHATDIIARVENAVIAFISPACEVVTGLPPQAFVGRLFYDVIHPEDRAAVATAIGELFESGAKHLAEPIEYRLQCADGGWRWVASHPNVVPNSEGVRESIAVIRDITEAKKSAAVLEASEARYRLLAETATDMISRFSLGGRIKFITPACERILGYTPEELVGVRTLDLTHPDDVPDVVATYSAYAAAGPRAAPIVTRYRARHRDGRWIWLEGMPRVVFDPATGKAVEMQDVVRDVTARHELELELIAAREAAEAGAQAKTDFLANMSHELRTPLNSIVGFSGLIAKAHELLPETRRRAELVSGASRSLVAIVNDILDMSRMEAEGVSLEPEPIDLDALLIAAVDLVREEADRKDVRVAVQILRPAGPLELDPVRVRQVVLNLLGNALKFTERGGRITLTLTDEPDDAVRVAVRDTGVGVAADRLESIFARFAQADSATSRRFGGTGLGLTICRSLVEAMGGRVGVTSTLGQGSTFWFTLPRRTAAAERVGPTVFTPSPPVATTPDVPLRVLLVDDNDVNRDLFGAMTAGRGLSIVEAADGFEAVARVRDQPFDVVLMDVQMPVMDGLEATRAIRAMGRADLPILAMTANVLPADIDRCREAGMNDHLAKPYTIDGVMSAIRRWTPRRTTTDDLRAAIGGDMLDGFLGRLAAQLQDLSQVFEGPACTPVELARRTHRIRGLAGSLGLADLAAAYGEIEAGCATPGLDDALWSRARQATAAGLDAITTLRAA